MTRLRLAYALARVAAALGALAERLLAGGLVAQLRAYGEFHAAVADARARGVLHVPPAGSPPN